MSRLRIAVLGGTGFIGRSLCERLVADGHEVRILTRRAERHRELLVLPTAQVIDADVHNPAVLKREFQGLDAVVNLVGILNEPGRNGKGFERVHTELPAKVVQACRQSGVARLLHMSALHASADAPSHYLRSKGLGEKIVHEAQNNALHVTSFRPSVIFGPHDSFTNRFAALLRQVPFVFPLACANARLQPVYVGEWCRRLCSRSTGTQLLASAIICADRKSIVCVKSWCFWPEHWASSAASCRCLMHSRVYKPRFCNLRPVNHSPPTTTIRCR